MDNNTQEPTPVSGGKKYIKYLVILVIVILFFYSLFLALRSKKQVSTNPVGEESLTVPTQNGQTLQVKDFTKNPVEKVGDTQALAETDNFSIVYFSKDQSFLITILLQPVGQSRQLAETEFLNKLQIKETDACRLKVSLTVPVAVDENLAGQDYGLSFCPAGKAFPSSN